MTALVQTLILVAIGSLLLWPHELLMQTWDVMFGLIVLSMLIAACGSYFIYQRTTSKARSQFQMVLGMIAGTTFFGFAWLYLWAASEEGLIHFSRWYWGPDDMGNRYFYPGNSGMGYASGLAHPIKALGQAFLFSLPLGILLGLPFGMAAEVKNNKGEQGGAGNPLPAE